MSAFAFLISMAPDEGAIAFEASSVIGEALLDGHSAFVFLYEDGVYFGSGLREIPQGDLDAATALTGLANHSQCTIVACVTAAERRGLSETSLADGIKLGGLGEWTEAVINADSVVQFK